jgi:hypothetical protein
MVVQPNAQQASATDLICFPYTPRSTFIARAILLVVALGISASWVFSPSRLEHGFLLMVVLVGGIAHGVFVHAYRAIRSTAYFSGEKCDATVVDRGTSSRGAIPQIVARYEVGGVMRTSKSFVPMWLYLRYHVGNKLTIRVHPRYRSVWVYDADAE